MAKAILLFPGQGSQYISMGESLFKTKEGASLIEEANDALGFSIKEIMLQGPLERLTDTSIAQPAILIHSILAYKATISRDSSLDVTAALGHSLGEYSALVSASVLSFFDAISLVHKRGIYMKEAASMGENAMHAVLGLDAQKINCALKEFNDPTKENYAAAANYNGPMQTVIAGRKKGVVQASEKLKSLGAKRIIPLNVSAPFHCQLMKPVLEKMAKNFESVFFENAKFPIISNVLGKSVQDKDEIKSLLIKQITSPVRFTECINHAKEVYQNAEYFLELGPKNTLTSISKKMGGHFKFVNVDKLEDLEKL